MYYGQSQEDRIIETYFPTGYIGSCIDVGSSDGVIMNNTKYFEDKGWYCMCFEPNPAYFYQCEVVRKNAYMYAISNFNDDNANFNVVNLDGTGVEEAITSLKINDALWEGHIKRGFDPHIRVIKTKVRTLNWIMENHFKYDKVDFVSIDTEGTELDVLKGFDIKKYDPKLFIIENTERSAGIEEKDKSIEEYLLNFEYELDIKVGVNDIYVKKINEKKVKYYAEFETDRYIRENYFPDFSYKGVMIEVGAGPTTFYSMSKHFRDNGWRAICVEPMPKFAEMHRKEGNEIYECACSFEDKDNVNFEIVNTGTWKKDIFGDVEGISFSSLGMRNSHADSNKHMIQNLKIENIKVKVLKLNTLLESINIDKVDFVSIDTEGWELEVMRGFDVNKYKPNIILLENVAHSKEYIDYMQNIGYQLDKVIEYNYIFKKINNYLMDTFGNIVDKLTIVNLKIWKFEDIKRDPSKTDAEIAEATRKTNILNQQRNDLIQELDEMLIDASKGVIKFKNYKQGETKSYG
jgi:FkbM family methyltransferase